MNKEELKNIPRLEERIKAKEEQIEILRSRATSITLNPISVSVKHSPCDNSMAIVDKIIALTKLLEEDINKLTEQKIRAYREIRKLPGEDREVLELRFIEGKHWEEIAETMHYSYRHVLRIYNRAMMKLFGEERG